MKIIDKINEQNSHNKKYYSFEYYPPKTKTGLQNLYIKLEEMGKLEPLFIDITWGAGGSTADLTLDLCKTTQNIFSLETQMHLTCTNMKEDIIRKALDEAKKNNIRNILALRGDPPEGKDWKVSDENFRYALDLIKFIKKNYGDYFCICVAGYPEGHPDNNYDDDLNILKQKVDAGADLIITQLFYDTDFFLKFVDDCKNLGIKCPILPGILPIVNYNNFKRMTGFCKVNVPEEITKKLESIKDNDEEVSKFGINLATKMCKKIFNHGLNGIHLYTLNRVDSCFKILNNLNLLDDLSDKKKLPWKSRIDVNENVRPIFWANTKEYYIQRTSDWNSFPNGRWGNKNDSQFGNISDYHLFGVSTGSKKSKLKSWGKELNSIEDIINVFTNFIEKKIKFIPWCDYLSDETELINSDLLNIIKKGYLTINSQPKQNGLPSEKSWGGKGGFLYQKSYLEFFCSEENFNKLNLNDKNLSYCAVNNSDNIITNCNDCTIAVTWGVFPNKQIIQPTIVDYDSFLIWKKDAFKLWINEWSKIYDKESKSYKLINEIYNNYYLVFIVDNDYINGNIFEKIMQV